MGLFFEFPLCRKILIFMEQTLFLNMDKLSKFRKWNVLLSGILITLLVNPVASSFCVQADTTCDGAVSDFELLDYINLWAQNLVGDFNLLDAIDAWTLPPTQLIVVGKLPPSKEGGFP